MSRFLERWSRLKKAAEATTSSEPVDAEALLANLGPDSDFSAFLKEEVSEAVRRQAMKTLFADPHFNIMDGLDIYIDDYSISEPIPEAMMATLNHARGLLFDAPDGEAEAQAPEDRAAAGCDILTADGQNVALPDGLPAPATENQSLGEG